jgi:hypothetical protein
MEFSVKCYTLFDITNTGVLNKHRNTDTSDPLWLTKRNTQCNFDTILQVISLRSQPDVIHYPSLITCSSSIFGTNFHKYKEITCWEFEFSVQHNSVFGDEFNLLYTDCNDVPMIILENNYPELIDYLNTSTEFKNIHFGVS